MNLFNLKIGTTNPVNIIDDINKLKNKKSRNDRYLNEKAEISYQIAEEIQNLEEKYHKEVANDTYLKLSDFIAIFGEESVQKVMKHLKHISSIKDDGRWIQSKIQCFCCSLENHLNICNDNSKCDRGLSKCIGTKISLIQVKEEEGKLF